ncbi:MAG: lysylphosphatidylglycerol synthase transmembrane domain-containing protein [Metamycoplasmataceae bacterium]
MNNDSLSVINENKTKNVFVNSFKKIRNSDEYSNKIHLSLNMINGRIISKIDHGSNSINDLTFSNIIGKYIAYITYKNISHKNFLIISDKNLDIKVYSQLFASFLKDNNINVYFPSNNDSINIATSFANIDASFGGVISFTSYRQQSDLISINFFNNDGSLLSNLDSSLFNESVSTSKTSECNLNIYDESIEILHPLDTNNYLSTLPNSKDLSNIIISLNNSYKMSEELLDNFFSKNNIKYITSKNSKPSNNKNIKKAILNSIRKRSDIALSFLQDNNSFEIAIKHKKQYIFYDLNDLAAMYLYYQIKYINNDPEYFKNKYIVKNISTSDLISIIAKKNKITVKEYKFFSSMLSENKDLESGMILATNGTNYFITNGQINYISDPLYNLQLILEMISFFKGMNKTLYDVMLEISIEYGIFRHSTNKQNMDYVTARKFFNIMSKTRRFNGQKIIRFDKIENESFGTIIVKIQLEDNSKISFDYSHITSTLVSYLSLVFDNKKMSNSNKKKKKQEIHSLEKNENYIDLIIKEKKIIENIKLFNEDYSRKKTSWKDFLKYFVFVTIFIGIFVILFNTLYSSDGNPLLIFKELNNLIRSNDLLTFLIPVLVLMFMIQVICNAILIGRMLKVQGQKVQIRHLMIASCVGVVITNITPLSVGGDIASYWYLIRKGLDRESLIATFLATSLLYQVVGAIFSIIFIPMGLFLYGDLFQNGSIESLSLFIFVLIGFFGNLIGALFIGILSFSRRVQAIFIKLCIQVISLNPFIISRDPSSQAASFQYAFMKIRASSLKIFKNFWIISELIIWRSIPYFVSCGAVLAIISGLMKPNEELWGGQYLNFVICYSILIAANAISITPGGSGTSQLLQTQIFKVLFKGMDAHGNPIDVGQVSVVFSLLSTILFFIIPTILSGLLLLTVWIGEKRLDKYSKVKRVISYESKDIQNKNIRKYTHFYKIATSIWVIGLIAAIITYYIPYALYV